ncbi:hypothetical protein B0H17DRAFT_249449 [Mycena rosella]|uniref:Uncharacterized protein n=1 Tax=Mycena rosella TaxID=1033263 RepID=A0AAD7H205_MYCRO|nr:hypothetical protein B0H17DRAFT_249449 [Mycena rosella]
MYMDHLNSARLIADVLSGPQPAYAWSSLASLAARSLYRWLKNILLSSLVTRRSEIIYTRAQTTSRSLLSRVNAAADALASGSHVVLLHPPACPVPTFFMDKFSFYTEEDRFIESNITSYLFLLCTMGTPLPTTHMCELPRHTRQLFSYMLDHRSSPRPWQTSEGSKMCYRDVGWDVGMCLRTLTTYLLNA